MRNSIFFYLNGVKKEVKGAHVFQPLSSFLRYEKRLTGTKVVCAEGDCGACTVMISRWSPEKGQTEYVSVNSCIMMSFALDGTNLITVEGLQEQNTLNEVQCSMVRNFGGQCGFCTPGFVMSIMNLHEHKEKPNEQNVKNYLTGNLCRCTGYAPIIKAALDVDMNKHVSVRDQYPAKDTSSQMKQAIFIEYEGFELFAPVNLQDACAYKMKNPDAVIFSGATDLGVQFNKGHIRPQKIMSLHLISELYELKSENEQITVGARVTLSDLQTLIEKEVPSFDQFLNIFASPQIKNSATLVGNVANASPIADTTPVLMSLDAVVVLMGLNGPREVPLQNFYLGYKKLDLKTDEIITHIRFNKPPPGHKLAHYKVSQRRDLDISTVNASFNFKVNNNIIEKAVICYGGVAATTLRMTNLENQLQGKTLNTELKNEIKTSLVSALQPLSDLRGSSDYRKVLIANLFEKFATEELGESGL